MNDRLEHYWSNSTLLKGERRLIKRVDVLARLIGKQAYKEVLSKKRQNELKYNFILYYSESKIKG